MGHHFVSVDCSTPFLMPPSLKEWLPDEHLARFIVEVVEHLDLSPLELLKALPEALGQVETISNM
jgi:hypothetical protein